MPTPQLNLVVAILISLHAQLSNAVPRYRLTSQYEARLNERQQGAVSGDFETNAMDSIAKDIKRSTNDSQIRWRSGTIIAIVGTIVGIILMITIIGFIQFRRRQKDKLLGPYKLEEVETGNKAAPSGRAQPHGGTLVENATKE
ncbi:hypothetical protein BGZ60DRAFT_425183 [Tricladium varicosporioides]|nr:hypothetical protein BGZ60DRAFT_425183 [Hymenoscyphus varicosporioides]